MQLCSCRPKKIPSNNLQLQSAAKVTKLFFDSRNLVPCLFDFNDTNLADSESAKLLASLEGNIAPMLKRLQPGAIAF
jgi:hypothetical protein